VYSIRSDVNQDVCYILEELQNSDNIQLVKSKDDWDDQCFNTVLGLKGVAHLKELGQLQELYHWGFRHAALVGEEVLEDETRGLTNFEFELIEQMNRLGMAIDITGVSPNMFSDILPVVKGPLIATCSNCYGLTPNFNNLTNNQIQEIIKTDGFIGVTTTDSLLKEATVSAFVDHIDYLKELVGTRYISTGFNFMNYLDSEISHLDKCKNVTETSYIIDELLKRNYSSLEIESITSINAKRVINKILKA